MALRSRFRFTSFRARLLTFVLGLLILIQTGVLVAVNAANESEARGHIDDALDLTSGAFRNSLETRERILMEKARLLSSDFAFKEASATGDHPTLLSALENHRARVEADVMMLLSMGGHVRADTLHPDAIDRPSALLPLVSAAMDSEVGEAAGIHAIDDTPYQLVVVPLFTPEPSAWIVIGFAIDNAFATQLGEETRTQVSLLWRGLGGWRTFSSTLPALLRRKVEEHIALLDSDESKSQSMRLIGEEFVTRVVNVDNPGGLPVAAVLQRSLEAALKPYLFLRTLLFVIFALGVGLSLIGGLLLAARVTRPVAGLARAARRIAAGNYDEPVDVNQSDELGLLAGSFNHMMKGLAERDAVRDLLGKVVSPEIAEELLSKEIELGGEERTVSMLFTDLRDFTTVAEREPPQKLVSLVNAYLGWASSIVEDNGGVVGQYVGDAVMALFGAPLQHEDDAERAVRVAMQLRDGLHEVNEQIAKQGSDPIALGVGVHTGRVVAGNMGSPTRLNYTVVGDSVNLASRIEGLTKRYKVAAIVSDATRQACSGIVFRELDQVRVKGRLTALRIFEPLGLDAAVDGARRERLAQHDEAMACYRSMDWDGADAIFRELSRDPGDKGLYEMYLERTARLRGETLGPSWDGTANYSEK